MTNQNDVVLIYFDDIPSTFARIEEIQSDHRPGWHHVKFLFLQIPLQVFTWILRESYIDGDEFTMSGKRVRIEKIICPTEIPAVPIPEPMRDIANEISAELGVEWPIKPADKPAVKSVAPEKKPAVKGQMISFPGLKKEKKKGSSDTV